DKLPQKTLIIIVIFYLVAFIYFFTFSIVSFASVNIIGNTLSNPELNGLNMEVSVQRDKPESEIQILSNFKISWILSNSVRLFIQYLLPVQSTALIIAFSLIFPWKLGPQGMQIPFVDVIGKSIFLFLILTLIFSGLTEGVLPGTLKKQSKQLYLTKVAIDYFEKARNELSSEKKDKNYSIIVDMLNSYLQIDPKNPVVKDTLDWAVSIGEIDPEKSDLYNSEKNENSIYGLNSRKAADLLIKASDYFNEEEYFSALYYANLAYNLDNSRPEAQRIAAESRQAIRSLEPDNSEVEAKKYYAQKRLGFDTLNEGNPIDAYYIFKELSVSSNEDKDIQEFLNRCLKEISDNSFFIDEAEKYLTVSGIDDIVFLDNQKTLIYIKKMILLDESEAFFFNIEVVKFDNSNNIENHFTAPYGKYNPESESIIMYAIDRDDSTKSYKPDYITGSDIEPFNIIQKLSPHLTDLNYLGQSFNSISFMNIIELYNYGSIFNNFGYIEEPAQILLLERIIRPFTFLIISFLSVSLGWFLRIRKYTFPLFALLLIPIIAYLLNSILSIYEFGINLVLGYSLFKTGFYPALVILLV
ncbi:MAG: hypothetical protein KAH95_00305, partial [Spirochaetales bacterium]|nr:hypothetical protein [Spirochaetales bacterium]